MKQYKKAGVMVAIAIGIVAAGSAQKNKFLFTTGVGLIKSPGALSKVIHPTVAFNSGLEYTGKTNWFAQVTLDFNSLKYDQRRLDESSPYLFQRTSSSLIQGAISGGYNIYLGSMSPVSVCRWRLPQHRRAKVGNERRCCFHAGSETQRRNIWEGRYPDRV